ncbi:MAG: glycosyltransferase family 9 protein, partial [Xanthomonadales bacterium]|nr:glycosyltransferase family 9 protein [Xanthomonadales bacterium]
MTRSASPSRPLLVRCGAMGDMVLLQPLLARLAQRYGSPVDLLSSGGWTRPLLQGQPQVGEILLLQSRKRPYWISPDQWHMVATLRARPPGPVYFCDDTPQTLAILRRGGIRDPDRVDAYSAGLREADVSEHWLDRWRTLAERSPARWPAPLDSPPPEGFAPRFLVAASDEQDLQDWLTQRGWQESPLVLLQPGNKRTLKHGTGASRQHHKYWPEAHWAEVAAQVAARSTTAQLLLCGAPPEHDFLEQIHAACMARGLTGRVHNLALDLPIPRLMALCARANGMISIDTGPAHLAAAVGCPLVVLFGAAPPAKWAPRSDRSAVLCVGGDRGRQRVAEIAVAEVI